MVKGCVIFDFDGVIADTEALHFGAYNRVLGEFAGEIGGEIVIGREDYFGKYIVYGDREGFWHMLRDHGRQAGDGLIERLMAAKQEVFQRGMRAGEAGGAGGAGPEPLPGVREVLGWLEEWGVPRGICSGARREEIRTMLEAFGLLHHFEVMVTIEDVRHGKPEPEGYELAFERLNLEFDAELEKEKSLVIEDSAGGCAAGRAAGLRVLGVGTSLPVEVLRRCATWAVGSLKEVGREELAGWLGLGG